MRGSLFRRYAAVLMLLVGTALAAGGLLEVLFNYRETREQVDLRQGVEARVAATQIRGFLQNIEGKIAEIGNLPWPSGLLGLRDRRDEIHRLLKLNPPIAEIRVVDGSGRERLHVSRLAIDELDSATPLGDLPAYAAARRDGVHYSPTYFKDGSEPYVTLGVRDGGPGGWVTLAEINLKFVSDLIREFRFGRDGRAYVVDGTGRLVAHPNLRHVLRNTDVSVFAPVRALRSAPQAAGHALIASNLDGVEVLTTSTPVGVAGWQVFVEQPVAEAYAPIYASIVRTLILFLLGILLALVASYYLARRLSRPILAVQRGAARLGAGELETRIHVKTGDEVEALADEFNHMAAELHDLYGGLERKVTEKTAQLEAANRHKSEFLANMSHELRTPLNAIIGFSEVLKERLFGELNPKQLEYARDIHGSGLHLLSLINDILDLTKIEAGHMSLDVHEFDVHGAVQNCCTLVRERALRQRVKLSCEVEAGVAAWPADERKFKQVLLNLLINAVKFTPAGGSVSLYVRVDGHWLAVSVADTGIGIAPEDRAAIFEEFRQIRASGEARHEGTGLGLTISRRLVELHHGTLTVESEPGKGSTFTARFPRRIGDG